MGVGYRNQEGYADPVPYLAISNMNVQYYPSWSSYNRDKLEKPRKYKGLH